ncbi:MAG: hypothetical protein K8I00_01355 [Candidatus Omnitrophica bacterium]|nr:hypothetical protein [Candidatus Omnitrophota bacterium]
MNKYAVILNGEYFWARQDSSKKKRYGFYTTRYIEAPTREQASKDAMEHVVEELESMFIKDPTNPGKIEVVEVSKLDTFDGIEVPGAGFTLYPEKKDVISGFFSRLFKRRGQWTCPKKGPCDK